MEMIIDRIGRLLKEKNKMAVDLCNALDIQQSTMSTWKSRRRNPPAEYMPTIASFLGALSEVRKINDLRRFCCLRVSYSPNFVLFQHFSEHFYRSFMIPLRHKHIRFPARISSVICSNRTENFLLF